MSRAISSDLIILDIGIELCTNCPYYDEVTNEGDCIGTDTELCHLMKDEVRKVREKIQKKEDEEKRKILENIQDAIERNESGLTIPELRDIYGYEYGFLQSLMRRGILESKRTKSGKRTKVLITGVNF
jgi:hypothetical protein